VQGTPEESAAKPAQSHTAKVITESLAERGVRQLAAAKPAR
jgi:hypothetical protein